MAAVQQFHIHENKTMKNCEAAIVTQTDRSRRKGKEKKGKERKGNGRPTGKNSKTHSKQEKKMPREFQQQTARKTTLSIRLRQAKQSTAKAQHGHFSTTQISFSFVDTDNDLFSSFIH